MTTYKIGQYEVTLTHDFEDLDCVTVDGSDFEHEGLFVETLSPNDKQRKFEPLEDYLFNQAIEKAIEEGDYKPFDEEADLRSWYRQSVL